MHLCNTQFCIGLKIKLIYVRMFVYMRTKCVRMHKALQLNRKYQADTQSDQAGATYLHTHTYEWYKHEYAYLLHYFLLMLLLLRLATYVAYIHALHLLNGKPTIMHFVMVVAYILHLFQFRLTQSVCCFYNNKKFNTFK